MFADFSDVLHFVGRKGYQILTSRYPKPPQGFDPGRVLVPRGWYGWQVGPERKGGEHQTSPGPLATAHSSQKASIRVSSRVLALLIKQVKFTHAQQVADACPTYTKDKITTIINLMENRISYPLEISGLEWSSMSKTVSARPPVLRTMGTCKIPEGQAVGKGEELHLWERKRNHKLENQASLNITEQVIQKCMIIMRLSKRRLIIGPVVCLNARQACCL